jgi:hypothetical protein
MVPIGTATHIPLFRRMLGPTQTIEPVGPALTLHYAVPSDTDAIDGLPQLDPAPAPRGVVRVADDPFQPAGELVALLVERAQQCVACSAAAFPCCRACSRARATTGPRSADDAR